MKRLLIAIATLLGVAIAPFSAVPAYASVMEYQATCSAHNCSPAGAETLWVSAYYKSGTLGHNETDEIEVWGTRTTAKGTMTPDHLKVVTYAGTFYPKVSAACTEAKHCLRDVPGLVKSVVLTGHFRFWVSFYAGSRTIKRGVSDRLHGSLPTAADGRLVYLQRYYSSAWHDVSSKSASYNSHTNTGAYSFTIRPTKAATLKYRVRKPSTSGIARGFSRTITITVT
jgi:hypothetical protein